MLTICITGTLSVLRRDFKSRYTGIKFVDDVSGRVNYLIVGEKTESKKKIMLAKWYGISILDEKSAERILKKYRQTSNDQIDTVKTSTVYKKYRDVSDFIKKKEQAIEARDAAKWALSNPYAIILDIETTDLIGYACEIAIIKIDGTILFNRLINPLSKIDHRAYLVHGIKQEDVDKAQPLSYYAKELADILSRYNLVIGYNVSFDYRILRREILRLIQMGDKNSDTTRLFKSFSYLTVFCAMKLYDLYAGKRCKLNGEHRALGDAQKTLSLIQEMANSTAKFSLN